MVNIFELWKKQGVIGDSEDRVLDTERKAAEVIYEQTALACRRQQPIVPDVLRHAVEDCERTGQSNP